MLANGATLAYREKKMVQDRMPQHTQTFLD